MLAATRIGGWAEAWIARGRGRGSRLDRAGALLGVLALAAWTHAVMLDGAASDPAGDRAHGAGPAGTTGLRAPAEWLVAGYVGAPYTHASDMRFLAPGRTDLTVHDIPWIGRPFKSPIYYGLRGVRWWGGGPFGGMLDFTHSKAIADATQSVRLSGTREGRTPPARVRIGEAFKHLEFSHGHNMVTANGMFRLGHVTPRLVPYVGAGGGANLPHTEIQFTGDAQRTYEYQFTGPTGQALVGLEIRLPRVSLFLEYKLTVSRYEAPLTGRDNKASFGYTDFLVQLASWWRGERPRDGYAYTTLVSHQVIGGGGPRLGIAAAAP